MQFGSLNPNATGQAGLALLKQIQGMQRPMADGSMPDPISGGFISKLMEGKPGGLIGALMKRFPSDTPGSMDPNAGIPVSPPVGMPAGGAPMGAPAVPGAPEAGGMPGMGPLGGLFSKFGGGGMGGIGLLSGLFGK